ncbi:MAG: hypothetical protein J5613_02435 [Alphaproteobacteria bacterium]|nr:hypothetical protein [Alphaproteobacteria bacterium]
MEDLQKLKEYGCFLVCDDDFTNYDSDIFKWLKSNGFRAASKSGIWGGGCNWAFINMYNKIYILGRPGVGYASPINNHAITIEEFKTIYEIYKKYEGKELFVFHKERFDYDRQK